MERIRRPQGTRKLPARAQPAPRLGQQVRVTAGAGERRRARDEQSARNGDVPERSLAEEVVRERPTLRRICAEKQLVVRRENHPPRSAVGPLLQEQEGAPDRYVLPLRGQDIEDPEPDGGRRLGGHRAPRSAGGARGDQPPGAEGGAVP